MNQQSIDLSAALQRLASDEAITLRPWGEGRRRCPRRRPHPRRRHAPPRRGICGLDRALTDGASCELAVVDAVDRANLLGSVGLVRIDWEWERAEVGFWTAPQARRRGIAQRAMAVRLKA
jgi:RimJ/RimL family protein N-acetyltransferase